MITEWKKDDFAIPTNVLHHRDLIHDQDVLIRSPDKHWAIATAHAVHGCSDAEKDITVKEMHYNASLIQSAPKMLELMTKIIAFSVYGHNPDQQSKEVLFKESILLIRKLLAEKSTVERRKDLYQVGDEVTVSKEMVLKQIVSFYRTSTLELENLKGPIIVVDVYDHFPEMIASGEHPQQITVKDGLTGEEFVYSGSWFEPIVRDEEKFNVYDHLSDDEQFALRKNYEDGLKFVAVKFDEEKQYPYRLSRMAGLLITLVNADRPNEKFYKASSPTRWTEVFAPGTLARNRLEREVKRSED